MTINYNHIALLICPCWSRITPPFAPAILCGNLRNNGYRVSVNDINNSLYNKVSENYKKYWEESFLSLWSDQDFVDNFLKENNEIIYEIINTLVASKVGVIGFTLYNTTSRFSLALAKLIKQKKPDIMIIIGGPEASLLYRGKSIITSPYVDAIISGEADESLPKALLGLNQYGHFIGTPGLTFKKGTTIIEGGNSPPPKDLDSIPFVDYSDFDLTQYADSRCLITFTSRGCINRCHYCIERELLSYYRTRSGKRLFEELQSLVATHPTVNEVRFYDSLLNGSIKALSEFCNLMINSNLNITWSGAAVLRKEMTIEILNKMHQAGCRYLFYGLETASDNTLKKMNKHIFNTKVASAVIKATHRAKIRVYTNIMIGYPTETHLDFIKTLWFMKKHRKYIHEISNPISLTAILDNSYLHKNCTAEFNIESNPHHLYWKTLDNRNTFPLRIKRLNKFILFCKNNKIPYTGAFPHPQTTIGLADYYYSYKKDFKKAYEYYRTLIKNTATDDYQDIIIERFIDCSNKTKQSTKTIEPVALSLQEKINTANTKYKASIVYIAGNKSINIIQDLAALFYQDFSSSDYEIILINISSRENISKTIKEIISKCTHHNITYNSMIFTKNKLLFSENVYSLCQGAQIIIIKDITFYKKNWLRKKVNTGGLSNK